MNLGCGDKLAGFFKAGSFMLVIFPRITSYNVCYTKLLRWRHTADVHAAIIEVSFPNEMEKLARMTGHLTPDLLKAELEKMVRTPARVYVTHPKPQYIRQIRKEISARNNFV